jgi:hypothetical protein
MQADENALAIQNMTLDDKISRYSGEVCIACPTLIGKISSEGEKYA